MRRLLKRLQGAATYFVQTVLGAVAGFAAFIAAIGVTGENLTLVALFVVAPLFSFLAVTIHEIGHALAAWRTKWRVQRIVVGRIAWSPRRKQKWSIVKRPAGARDIGGWVEADEPMRGATRKTETIYILGGPGANLATAVLCFVFASLPFLPYKLGGVLASFGVLSVALAVASLIPWRVAGAESDGMQLWRIWRPHRRVKVKPSRSGWKRTPDY